MPTYFMLYLYDTPCVVFAPSYILACMYRGSRYSYALESSPASKLRSHAIGVGLPSPTPQLL